MTGLCAKQDMLTLPEHLMSLPLFVGFILPRLFILLFLFIVSLLCVGVECFPNFAFLTDFEIGPFHW